MERDEARALLQEMHTFPGEYDLRVVARPEATVLIVTAVSGTLGEGRVLDVRERPSRNGRFVSLRLRLHVGSADVVLAAYDVLRNVDGVVTTL